MLLRPVQRVEVSDPVAHHRTIFTLVRQKSWILWCHLGNITIGYGSIPEQLLGSTRCSPSSKEQPERVSVQATRLPCASLTDLLQPLLASVQNLRGRLQFSAPEQAHGSEGSPIQALEGVLLPVLRMPNAGFRGVRSPQVTSLIFLGPSSFF